jgi:methyl-accepting chemotaxis protein
MERKKGRWFFNRSFLLLVGVSGLIFLAVGFLLFYSGKRELLKRELSRGEAILKMALISSPYPTEGEGEIGELAARLKHSFGEAEFTLSLMEEETPPSFTEIAGGRYLFKVAYPLSPRGEAFLLLSYERDISRELSFLFKRFVLVLVPGFLLLAGVSGLFFFSILAKVVKAGDHLSAVFNEFAGFSFNDPSLGVCLKEVKELVSSLPSDKSLPGSPPETGDHWGRLEEGVRDLDSLSRNLMSFLEGLDTRLYQVAERVDGVSSFIDQIGVGLRKGDNSASLFDSESRLAVNHTEEVETSLSVMEGYINEISDVSQGLAKAVEETQTTMAKMLFSIQLIESNTKKSSELSARVEEDVELGKKAVSQTIGSMERINRAVAQAGEVIKKLGVRSVEIGEILNVIEDVAEQTNLLAVNASIIAAQAGEQGKSFAVVADEIRDLASRTSSSAKDIAKLIASVQRESAAAVKSMEEGSITVEEGVKLSREAGDIFERILEGTKESTLMMQKIAEATVEQTDSGNRMMEEIKKVGGMIEKVIQAAESYLSRNPDVNQAVGNLARLGEKLSSSSSSFVLEVKGLLELLSEAKERTSDAKRELRDEEKWRRKIEETLDTIRQKKEGLIRFITEEKAAGERLREGFSFLGETDFFTRLRGSLAVLKEGYERQEKLLLELQERYDSFRSQLGDIERELSSLNL